MFGDAKVIGDADLLKKFRQIQEDNRVNLPKYAYPQNVVTVSHVSYLVERGISIRFDKKDLKHLRGLESQKRHKKAIFGSGFLMSDKAATRRAQAEVEADRAKEQVDRLEKIVEKAKTVIWELSEKEREIIRELG